MKNIKKKSSNPNLCLSSYKKTRDKLLKDLTSVMKSLKETPETEYINFITLGNYMNSIGVYQILFNPNYGIKLDQNGNIDSKGIKYKSEKFSTRLNKEIQFHKEYSSLLSYMKTPKANCELVVGILMILFDITNNGLDELSNAIGQLLDAAYMEYRLGEGRSEPHVTKAWNTTKLVKLFKSLTESKYIGEIYNFEKAHRPQKAYSEKLKFEPAINSNSEKLSKKYIEKYSSKLQPNDNFKELKHTKSNSNLETRLMIIYERQKQIDKKIKIEQEKKMNDELKECTFKPILESKLYPHNSNSTTRPVI